MNDGIERLAEDAAILAAMAEQMPEYLDSDTIFWPAPRGGMPALTLGGYLLREHRLLTLSGLLPPRERVEAGAAVAQFNQALAGRVVRFEKKAQTELEARLRQWEESLKDMERGTFDSSSNYANVVDVRAIIQALVDRLGQPPYRIAARSGQHLAALDTRLRNRFEHGDFVWPIEWTAAYPSSEYWWLYGKPRYTEKSDNS